MDVLQAIQDRKSVRAFKATPVSRDTINDLLKLTAHAPSAINLQPWDFYAADGEEKERLSRRLLKSYGERQISCKPATVKPMPDVYRQRGRQTTAAMQPFLETMKVSYDQFINEGSCRFYGAPTAVIICLDDAFSSYHMIDLGAALGYLVLAAHGMGLASCPVGLIAAYADDVRDVMNIPENKRVVVGVALGFPDTASPIARFKSPREDIGNLVKWM